MQEKEGFIFQQIGTHNVCAQVNKQDGDGTNRKRDAGHDVDQEWAKFSNVFGQGVGNGFLQIVKDQATCRTETANGQIACRR